MAEGEPGLYAPGDLMWKVNREAVLLLAGPRALLMQVAHPLVAAGVSEHSEFRRDPLDRLRRTLDAMLGIIYGSREDARARATRINAVHARVSGSLGFDTTQFPRGAAYDALDPALLFWVQATLFDSARSAYECFVAPLTRGQRAQLYQQSKTMAPLLQLPAEHMPSDYEAFCTALDDTLTGPALEITPEARELADAVLHPELLRLPRSLWSAASVITLGLLPPGLRERYGFRWGERERRRWRLTRRIVRGALPLLPSRVRILSQARRAERARRPDPRGAAVARRVRS